MFQRKPIQVPSHLNEAYDYEEPVPLNLNGRMIGRKKAQKTQKVTEGLRD